MILALALAVAVPAPVATAKLAPPDEYVKAFVVGATELCPQAVTYGSSLFKNDAKLNEVGFIVPDALKVVLKMDGSVAAAERGGVMVALDKVNNVPGGRCMIFSKNKYWVHEAATGLFYVLGSSNGAVKDFAAGKKHVVVDWASKKLADVYSFHFLRSSKTELSLYVTREVTKAPK